MAKSLDWDQLRIFLAALRAGSLRGASEHLGVNHATINRAIKGLESSLGTKIFDRSVSGLTLTQSGETLVGHAEEIERQTLKISQKLSGQDSKPSGTIRVSLPPSLAYGFIAPILASFSKIYPDISVQIISTNKRSNLERNEADISIRTANNVEDDVVGRRVVQFSLCVYASPDYLASLPDLKLGDGYGAHWITWGKKVNWIKSSVFPNAVPRHYLPEIPMQIEAAANGLGLINVPCFLADPDPRLVRVPGAVVTPGLSIWLLLQGDLQRTARVRAFVDHAANVIQTNRERFLGLQDDML